MSGCQETCSKCGSDPKCNNEGVPSALEVAHAIAKVFPQLECMVIDDHDNAVVGLSIDSDSLQEKAFKLVYDQDVIIENCMDFCADYDEAIEWCQYNIFDAYVGPGSPLFWYDDDSQE